MKPLTIAAATALALLAPQTVNAQAAPAQTVNAQTVNAPRPDQLAFRDLYKELVETDTSVATGSCTAAAEKMAARLKAAGYTDDQLTLFKVDGFPLDGGLVAQLPGTSRDAKPMLLLGHLDVVNARREDWQRDPFTLIEEGGYFYGRGTSDMKAMVATWVDTLIRLKQQGFRPKRTIKLALTCGEESGARMNGAQWLAENRPDLIAAEFALNEGGGGSTDGHGRVVTQSIQIGEKSNRNFEVETTNPGGHSSIPIDDNAIYALADAIEKVRAYRFPIRLNDTTRAFFAREGAERTDQVGRAMVALANDPADRAADALVSADRTFNSMLRTTCVATLLEAGHAANALPQRARATINCRIVPGEDADTTRAALIAAIGDAKAKVTLVGRLRPVAVPPPLDPKILAPAEKLVARYFPGVSLIPTMMTGATDATYIGPIGIPTYGVPGGWGDPDGNGTHGLNERREVRSVYVGRDFLFDLVKAYAGRG
ncbi:MAG: Peptidase M20:Peptidase dimerization [Sphingomonas bacterium]|uniref:M20/M25/M40 family metallo-hydrolase n=1 Tax=Sphingomonas bacterium TaxID=1895847 RepID=UPI0026181784|nr:M20/M25/M40 family metallo-hydrolase [Sphingomonas bacterium]MDB5705820.1 Peptidase M20:Peptidase dimerization [Sphingomonas bacterium]